MNLPLDEVQAALFLKEQYELDGYNVIMEPPKVEGGEFLGSYRPDLLLTRGNETIVVEIKRRRRPEVERQLDRLRDRIEEHAGWKFKVHYLDESTMPKGPPTVTQRSIETLIDDASTIFLKNYKKPAFLALWAAFEAAARRISQSDFEKPQTPGRIITILAERGIIEPDEADKLRILARKRNNLVHGALDISVETHEFDFFKEILAKLLHERSPPTTGRI